MTSGHFGTGPYGELRWLTNEIKEHMYQLAQARPLGIGKKRQKTIALSLASLRKRAAALRRSLRAPGEGRE